MGFFVVFFAKIFIFKTKSQMLSHVLRAQGTKRAATATRDAGRVLGSAGPLH